MDKLIFSKRTNPRLIPHFRVKYFKIVFSGLLYQLDRVIVIKYSSYKSTTENKVLIVHKRQVSF